MNPFILITLFAIFLQSAMLVLFYALPDPLGLSLSEMFAGKTVWQISMAYGAILVLASLFAFFKKPRILAGFFLFYFILAAVDYEVFRFSHQRLSYSFLRTYFHLSNITDSTTVSTLGGDFKGTVGWLSLLFIDIAGWTAIILYLSRKKKASIQARSFRIPVTLFTAGMVLSVIPLALFLAGTRGIKTIPVLGTQVDMRFTLGKHTLTAPILHIAAEETFEFVRDNYTITDELVADLDAFLPENFDKERIDQEFPAYRKSFEKEYRAKRPYNIVFIFGESFKGRILNQMLSGDTTLAPNLWALSQGKYFSNGGGGLWFENAFSGGYPTVRGTMATYFGFPSHPNRDVPSFYASNHFVGFPELMTDYVRQYMTISNPIFDHTLPFIEKFYGNDWKMPEPGKPGTTDSLGMDIVLQMLDSLPTDSSWLLTFNTISTHIPFYGYPDDFAPKPDNAMERYRNALRYTDSQLGKLFKALAERPDFDRTAIVILGDHDTPVDSIDYTVPQPLGVAAAQIFIGIFSADSNLFSGLEIRKDVASQLDIGPTVLDLAQVKAPSHFWGYDLLTEKRPAEQPALFFSQNAYFLGFRDFVLTGGLESEEIYRGANGTYSQVNDSLSSSWRNHAVGASKVLRSLLRNDKMLPVSGD